MRLARLLFILFLAAFPCISHSAMVFRAVKTPLFINGSPKGEFLAYRDDKGEVYLPPKTFTELEIPLYLFKERIISYGRVPLKSLAPRLTHAFSEDPPRLDLTVDLEILKARSMESFQMKKLEPVRLEGKNTLFLNYSASYADTFKESDRVILAPHEVVASDDSFVFQHKGSASWREEERGWSRSQTNLVFDDAGSMLRYTAGDFTASGGQLGGAASLGGFNVSSAFFTDPKFIIYNMPTVSGMLDRPGKVDVYANDALVSSMSNVTGKFEYSEFSALTGSADIKIVKTYPDGTVEEELIDAYVSRRLLKVGLSDFSYGFGWKRDEFTSYNFAYDEPRFIMRHRYGVHDWLTAGIFANIHGQGSTRGFILQTLAGNNGELSIQGGMSDYKDGEEWRTGTAAVYSYLYSGSGGSAGVEVYRKTSEFTTGANPPAASGGMTRTRVNLSRKLGKIGFFSTRYEYTVNEEGKDDRDLSAILSSRLLKKLTLTLSGKYSFAEDEYNLAATFTVPLGKNANMAVKAETESEGSTLQEMTVERSIPYGTGPYYSLYASRKEYESASEDPVYRSNIKGGYAFTHGDVNASVSMSSESTDSYRLGVSGSAGIIDGVPFMSRNIKDSVILVKASDLDGVPVGFSGRPQGQTSDGYCVLPSVPSYITQSVTANLNGLPVEYKSDKNDIPVIIGFRKGGVVDLEISKTSAVKAVLNYLVDGKKEPAEFAAVEVSAEGKGAKNGFGGLDGLLYLENVEAGEWNFTISDETRRCTVKVAVPSSAETVIDLGEINCVPQILPKADPPSPEAPSSPQ